MNTQRTALIEDLQALLGAKWFLKTTEEFDGTPGGVWTTNERWSDVLEGYVMQDSISAHPKVEELLQKHGFFAEPYDSGTVMFWPT
jgi:hypothetical protein